MSSELPFKLSNLAQLLHFNQNEDVNSEQQTIDIYEDIDVTQTLEALDEAYSILKSWPNALLTVLIRSRIRWLSDPVDGESQISNRQFIWS
ncbi:hypothetical protein PGTUg99_002116 [Puccinia graminis f. sp. tritici]|uniref:Uncharacterized protein n=1 Tax=Puccinia graminis f. sp. tritici TaxID=56615 RepID=A0A5B0RR21_PUCGR|nr:hypothetical protein PGTUg99_002116 [Puccinia graminis f. sp. tritici]